MKRAALVLLALVAIVAAIVLFRATSLVSLQPGPEPRVELDLDTSAIAARFAEALTYPTISNQDRSDLDREAFLGLHDHFSRSYPLVHERLTRETVNDLSLVYTWTGRDPNLAPVLLMGHIDVVPVIPGTEGNWTHPPFGGVIADDVLWGRGALDDKISVVAILEAVETLLAQGFQPERTVYLAFGHDEEVGGPEGAGAIAALFDRRDVGPFALVLDEGGAIIEGMLPGIEGKAAIVGIAEKGFISLELSLEGAGGHSSTPPPHSNIGILAAAVRRLEDDPFPARLDGATLELFRYLAPEMRFGLRTVFANLWLMKPAVVRTMLGDSTSAAMVRTTTAVTIFNSGVKDNVLPITATAVVNFRILPGDDRAGVTERVRRVVDDERIQIRDVSTSHDPSAVSSPAGPGFAVVAKTIRQVIGDDVIIAPWLVVGGTDAKYYAQASENVLRFLPVEIGDAGLEVVHGTNERIGVAGVATAVRYMHQLIVNTDDLPR